MPYVIPLAGIQINIFCEVCFKAALGRIFCFLQGSAQGSTPLQIGHLKEEVPGGANTREWLCTNRCRTATVQISGNSNISPLLLWLQETSRSIGEKVLEVGWGREGQRAEGCHWKQDKGYCTHGECPWKAGPSPEGVSSRPEDGSPAPSAFSPLTTLPCVT